MALYGPSAQLGGSTGQRRKQISAMGEMDALLLGTTRELVAATPSHNNYKSILIALVVICVVCSLIFLSIQLLRPPDNGPRVKGRKITLSDITSNRFLPKPFNGTWISDNEILMRDYLGPVYIFNTDTLTSKTFVTNTRFQQLNANKFSVSADRNYLLLIHDESKYWDHSSLAKYTLYDIDNQFLSPSPLTPLFQGTRKTRASGHNDHQVELRLQYAEWGPSGNSIIMVYQNNIYYKEFVNESTSIQITTTGRLETIFNGVPDWLYEVEILKSNKALWVSPDGDHLFYASFNDTEVGEVFYPWYGENSPYSELRKWRYPKVGTTNPQVTLWAVNLKSPYHQTQLKFPEGIHSRDHYVSNVEWINNEQLSIVWLNREQNVAQYFVCEARKWTCEKTYTLKASWKGWLDFPQAPFYSSNGSSCLVRIPWRDGDAGYFHHIIWVDIQSGKEIPLTRGTLEVTQISAWDQTNQFVYFIAVPHGKPGERHLYRATENSSNSSLVVVPICLTCPPPPLDDYDEENTNGDEESPTHPVCLYNEVTFSKNNQLFIKDCLGPGFPTATLHSVPDGTPLFVLKDNAALQEEVINLGLPLVKNIEVQVSDGHKVPVRLFLPPGLRENEEFKFPLILHMAGAPGTQLVSEEWRLSWAAYLTSLKNFIVVEIDGRGTGYVGERHRHAVFQQLGALEVADQLEVMQYLKDNYPFIDENNTGVWGKGYGGYLTLLALAEDKSELFKCAVAVSPITKWEFYDTVYTERYLGLRNLSENFRGYEDGDVVRMVKKLGGRKFLIIHGTADEKVHYQHTLHLSKALIKEGVPFTEQVYPDEGHEYSGVTEHLYNAIEDFFELTFDKPDWDEWEKANFLGVVRG